MDYENILSRKVQDLQFSGIRKFFDIAASYDDVISLSVGEPDFKTPWAIRKEAIRVLEKGRTNYTANAGLADLRIAINDYINDRLHVSYDPLHEILVTAVSYTHLQNFSRSSISVIVSFPRGFPTIFLLESNIPIRLHPLFSKLM